MKLNRFKELDKKRKTILIIGISVILLIAAVLVYRSYAIYQEKQDFNVIKGSVPNQDYDVMVSYYVVDENGEKNFAKDMPSGYDYDISVECNNGGTATWNYDTWKMEVSTIKTRTKCNIYFKPMTTPLKSYGIMERLRESGPGLYAVRHDDATISADITEEQKSNLKMVEYRYAGQEVNNYVSFNNELWQIIGLVNTIDGSRLKLIRSDSIGDFSWDSSESSINVGWGINSWNHADAMKLLNQGGYYNRTTDTCYNAKENASTTCDFSEIGLFEESKKMIDTVTWNFGADASWQTLSASSFYESERSNGSSKICSPWAHCSDDVVRSTVWIGQVGLMYLSDYGYATSGGITKTREMCLNSTLRHWNGLRECFMNDWLYVGYTNWSLFPAAYENSSNTCVFIGNGGGIGNTECARGLKLRPSIYLKNNVKVNGGKGTKEEPYQLSL